MGAQASESGPSFGLLLTGGFLLLATLVVILVVSLLLGQRRQVRDRLPVLFTIPEFTLTNQQAQAVTLSDLHGSVWVADIIFTRCAGPCPLMTQRMSELQSALPTNQRIKLVSLTTDADYDTPAVLKAYAARFGAQQDRWWFLTGDKRAIANLAIDGFKFVAADKKPEERTDAADLFVHSTFFVVVDQQGRARAVFNYDDPGMTSHVIRVVHQLLNES